MISEALYARSDEDESGTLEVDEIQRAFQKLDISMTDEEVKKVFAEIKGANTNLDSVDLAEFRRVVEYAKAEGRSQPRQPQTDMNWEIPVGVLRSGPEKVRRLIAYTPACKS